jgi:general secretion pathway protein A
MYQAFFGLREKPFSLTPDPKFLYLNASYREALAALHYAIAERKGFAALVGEAGTGKTTLLRRLLSELPRDTRSVLVINPAVGFEDLLRFILTDLGRPPAPGTSKLEMLEALNAELLDTLARGGNVVVFIDEAQDLTIPVLEELRLLSNLETAKEKIIQFVLAGQPELELMLARPEIRQLRQRIAVNARLRALGRAEVQAYVAARIAAAGGDERGLFRPGALHRLWRFSQGVPRLVNVACDNALVTAYAAGRRSVGWQAMGEAIRDLGPADRGRGRAPRLRLRSGTIAVAAVVGVVVGVGASRLAGSPGLAWRFPAAMPPSVAPEGAATPQAPGRIPAAPPVAEHVPAESAPAYAAVPPPAEAPDEAVAPGGSGGDATSAAQVAVAEVESTPPAGSAAVGGGVAGPGAAAPAPSRESAPPPQPVAVQEPAPPAPMSARPPSRPAIAGREMPAAGEVDLDARRSDPREVSRESVPEARLSGLEERPSKVDTRRGGITIRVERGDTLTAIAMRHYGQASAELLAAIKQANPSLQDPNLILTGGTIVLPAAPAAPGSSHPPVVAHPE